MQIQIRYTCRLRHGSCHRHWINLARNGPQESRDLARDRHGYHGGAFSLGHQAAIACAQACLCLPGQWQIGLSQLMANPDASRIAISPCCFDQGFAGAAVACLGDAALSFGLPCRAFRRHQAKKGHQLPRMLKAP
jgi:hypothetical protein